MKSEAAGRMDDDVVGDFAEHTTAHGFANVKRSESWFGKGIWIIALLLAWAVCGIQLATNISDYFEYPTTTSVSISHSSQAQFPAVTICNLNSLRSQEVADDSVNNYTDITNNLMSANVPAISWEDFDTSGSNQPLGPNDSQQTFDPTLIVTESSYKMANMRDVYNTNMNVSLLGHQIEDMLLDCTFEGRQCLPKNFTKWQHGTFGNCYTMVIRTEWYPSFVGPDYGLALTLFTEEQQYMPMITPAAGFRVELHSPFYMPFPEDLGFTISPGFLTSAAVQQQRLTRQPLPYDGTDCGKSLKFQNTMPFPNVYESWSDVVLNNGLNSTMNYTNQACMKSCYEMKLAEICGCVNAAYVTRSQMQRSYGILNAPPACDQSITNVSSCIQDSTTSIDSECNTMCYQPCMEEDYEARITTSLWPRAEYFGILQSSWAARNPLIANMTNEDARDKIAKLEVYFRVLNYEAITESVGLTLLDLLTNVGGTVGLYGGLSFLTILEFLEFFARYCSSKRKSCQDRSSRVSSSSTFRDAPGTMRYPVKSNEN